VDYKKNRDRKEKKKPQRRPKKKRGRPNQAELIVGETKGTDIMGELISGSSFLSFPSSYFHVSHSRSPSSAAVRRHLQTTRLATPAHLKED
jgi:hypothetical protein